MRTYWRILCALCLMIILSISIATSSEVTSHFKSECTKGERVGSRCLRLSEEKKGAYNYNQKKCQKGAVMNQEEVEFIRALMRDAGVNYIWIARQRKYGFGDCFYLNEYGSWIGTGYCHRRRKLLCATNLECQEGWIGEKCDQQCHCYKQNCTRIQKRCDYGCEQGWTGKNCSQVDAAPIVEYYCVKNSSHYSLVLSSDSTNASDSRSLVPLGPDRKPITSQNYSGGFDDYGILEISTTDLSLPFEPKYHERKIDETTFQWSFRLSAHNGVLMQDEMEFRVQCDFSKVDVMHSSTTLKFDTESIGKTTSSSPTPIEANVKLSLTDPKEDNQLTHISLGQPVKIYMSQKAEAEDSDEDAQIQPFLHLSPRACYARSPDNTVVNQLTDELGCRLDGDYFRWDGKDGYEEMTSDPFAAFMVPGYSTINISCTMAICFNNEYYCKPSCRHRP